MPMIMQSHGSGLAGAREIGHQFAELRWDGSSPVNRQGSFGYGVVPFSSVTRGGVADYPDNPLVKPGGSGAGVSNYGFVAPAKGWYKLSMSCRWKGAGTSLGGLNAYVHTSKSGAVPSGIPSNETLPPKGLVNGNGSFLCSETVVLVYASAADQLITPLFGHNNTSTGDVISYASVLLERLDVSGWKIGAYP